jgi:hypothetical protein
MHSRRSHDTCERDAAGREPSTVGHHDFHPAVPAGAPVRFPRRSRRLYEATVRPGDPAARRATFELGAPAQYGERMKKNTEVSFDAFWAGYLHHHRHPITRRLHFTGSSICLLGFAATAAFGSLWPSILAVALGYLFAFGGHWWIDRTRPLTFRHPLLAGLCNWRLFGLECLGLVGIGGGFEEALQQAIARTPSAFLHLCDDLHQ